MVAAPVPPAATDPGYPRSLPRSRRYVLKVQIGDKRWFKGSKNEAIGALDSFTVA